MILDAWSIDKSIWDKKNGTELFFIRCEYRIMLEEGNDKESPTWGVDTVSIGPFKSELFVKAFAKRYFPEKKMRLSPWEHP